MGKSKRSLAARARKRWRWKEYYRTVTVHKPLWDEIERLASKVGMAPQAWTRAVLTAEVARLKRGGVE